METLAIGESRAVEIDLCRRCGGIWLEHGEIQRLRVQPFRQFRAIVPVHDLGERARCHTCHAFLDREDDSCLACGASNQITCPHCDHVMRIIRHAGLRLDACDQCHGVWFDRHEVGAIWGDRFNATLRRQELHRTAHQRLDPADVGDLVLYGALYSPDLLYFGAAIAGDTVAAAGSAMGALPEALAALPDAAGGAAEVIVETSSGVIEVIVEIVASLFG
jgi:Zn-finger nucleic acid-binding protein